MILGNLNKKWFAIVSEVAEYSGAGKAQKGGALPFDSVLFPICFPPRESFALIRFPDAPHRLCMNDFNGFLVLKNQFKLSGF